MWRAVLHADTDFEVLARHTDLQVDPTPHERNPSGSAVSAAGGGRPAWSRHP